MFAGVDEADVGFGGGGAEGEKVLKRRDGGVGGDSEGDGC